MKNTIGMVEFTSISRGIYTADHMLKAAEVEIITAVSSCPGKYIVIIAGDVAAVQNAINAGEEIGGEYLVDTMVLANVTEGIFPALSCATMPEQLQAVGIIESFSLAAILLAADVVLKTANLEPIEIRLGNGIGGKGVFTFTGDVAAVVSGLDMGKKMLRGKGLLVNAEVIPSPAKELLTSLM